MNSIGPSLQTALLSTQLTVKAAKAQLLKEESALEKQREEAAKAAVKEATSNETPVTVDVAETPETPVVEEEEAKGVGEITVRSNWRR